MSALFDSDGPIAQLFNRLRNRFAGAPLARPAPEPAATPADAPAGAPDDYAERMKAEIATYKDVVNVNDLPGIYDYWARKHLVPMFEEFGVSNPDQFFAKYLREGALRCGDAAPVFISIGAGNCDTEVRVAKLLKETMDGRPFTIECLDMNPHMLARGREMAGQEGVAEHLAFVEADFNRWSADKGYPAVMANQSLHHVVELEGLFDEIHKALKPQGCFAVSDMIGRNGHQRWPEALEAVHRFWRELPPAYRYNQQLRRHEELYENWDCSTEGFEGIRAQDILPLLLERFHVSVFLAFGNAIDVFVDRGFGHNFDPKGAWDRDFIDRVHAFDEEGFRNGTLTPTHLVAVFDKQPGRPALSSRGLRPEACVRRPYA